MRAAGGKREDKLMGRGRGRESWVGAEVRRMSATRPLLKCDSTLATKKKKRSARKKKKKGGERKRSTFSGRVLRVGATSRGKGEKFERGGGGRRIKRKRRFGLRFQEKEKGNGY